jgi:hypothetical protein
MKNPTTKYYLHKMPSKPNNLHYFVQVPSNPTIIYRKMSNIFQENLIFSQRLYQVMLIKCVCLSQLKLYDTDTNSSN